MRLDLQATLLKAAFFFHCEKWHLHESVISAIPVIDHFNAADKFACANIANAATSTARNYPHFGREHAATLGEIMFCRDQPVHLYAVLFHKNHRIYAPTIQCKMEGRIPMVPMGSVSPPTPLNVIPSSRGSSSPARGEALPGFSRLAADDQCVHIHRPLPSLTILAPNSPHFQSPPGQHSSAVRQPGGLVQHSLRVEQAGSRRSQCFTSRLRF